MPSTSAYFACIAACALGVFAGMPGYANDLTLVPGAVPAASRNEPPPGVRADGKKERGNPPAKAGKPRRADKEAARRIVTYNLYQDPVFKLKGALADRRQLGALPPGGRAGSAAGIPLALHPSVGPSAAPRSAVALKLPEPESTGIDFGCRDKPFRGSTTRRELTACYKHNVDKAWKTQTYLSRDITEGSQKWGGGLAVRYAY